MLTPLVRPHPCQLGKFQRTCSLEYLLLVRERKGIPTFASRMSANETRSHWTWMLRSRKSSAIIKTAKGRSWVGVFLVFSKAKKNVLGRRTRVRQSASAATATPVWARLYSHNRCCSASTNWSQTRHFPGARIHGLSSPTDWWMPTTSRYKDLFVCFCSFCCFCLSLVSDHPRVKIQFIFTIHWMTSIIVTL